MPGLHDSVFFIFFIVRDVSWTLAASGSCIVSYSTSHTRYSSCHVFQRVKEMWRCKLILQTSGYSHGLYMIFVRLHRLIFADIPTYKRVRISYTLFFGLSKTFTSKCETRLWGIHLNDSSSIVLFLSELSHHFFGDMLFMRHIKCNSTFFICPLVCEPLYFTIAAPMQTFLI